MATIRTHSGVCSDPMPGRSSHGSIRVRRDRSQSRRSRRHPSPARSPSQCQRGARSPSPSNGPDAGRGLPQISEQRSPVSLGNGASLSSPRGRLSTSNSRGWRSPSEGHAAQDGKHRCPFLKDHGTGVLVFTFISYRCMLSHNRSTIDDGTLRCLSVWPPPPFPVDKDARDGR